MKLKTLLGVAISALLIWWTLRGESPTEIWATVRGGNFWLLGASVFVATAGFLIRAFRWRVLLASVKRDTALDSRFGAITIGFMANNLLPARVGEFVRAYAFGRMENVPVSGAFGSLVVERVLDGVVLLVFLLLPPLLPGFPAGGISGGAVGGLIGGMVVVLGVLLVLLVALLIWPAPVLRVAESALSRLPGKGGTRVIEALEAFLEALQVLRSPALLAQAVLWSFAFWTWHGVSFWLAMAAFGIQEGFAAAMFTEAAVGFGVAIPAAPGFFGTFHAAASWALEGVYGIDAARSLAFAYGYHLGGFVPVTLIGLWYARRIGLSLKEMGQSEERVERELEGAHPPVRGAARALTLAAPAKVNLYLKVLDREPGGYHAIRTLFQALEMADQLEVERTPEAGVRLEVTGFDAGPTEENLAWKAAARFLELASPGDGVRIRLEKRIPAGAGLGGGSSDAAATLRALDALFPGAVGPGDLARIAAELGSDVPFFLCGSPLALGEGRGERLEPLPPLPQAAVVVALPAVHVSTADAYRALDRARGEGATAPAAGARPATPTDWDAAARLAGNDFEAVVVPAHPEIRHAREALAATRPRTVLLCGSGAAVFAVYESEAAAEAALASLPEEEGVRYVATRTLTRIADPERTPEPRKSPRP